MKRYALILRQDTAAVLWQICRMAAELPQMPPIARSRALALSKQFFELQGGPHIPESSNDQDYTVAVELLDFYPAPARADVIMVEFQTLDGKPLADGRPWSFTAPGLWSLYAQVKEADRQLPRGAAAWIDGANIGDKSAWHDSKTKTRVTVTIAASESTPRRRSSVGR